jgi:hypothetical protein
MYSPMEQRHKPGEVPSKHCRQQHWQRSIQPMWRINAMTLKDSARAKFLTTTLEASKASSDGG